MTDIALTDDDLEELIYLGEGKELGLESGRTALKLAEERGDEHRWHTYHTVVFQLGDKTLAFDYPKPNSTEDGVMDYIRDEGGFEKPYEVKPVEVTTTTYERV